MYNDKINKFLDGDLDLEQLQKELSENTGEKDFIDSYQQVIKQNKIKVPDFNPFEKIKSAREKRISVAKRFLPYAASVLLVVSLFFVYEGHNSRDKTQSLNKQEILEIKLNTELALLHFSQELNACFAKFEDVKKMQQPVKEMESLKNIKIDKNNPVKNLKFN